MKEFDEKNFERKRNEMKINASPNQNLIDFVFIGDFVCGKLS